MVSGLTAVIAHPVTLVAVYYVYHLPNAVETAVGAAGVDTLPRRLGLVPLPHGGSPGLVLDDDELGWWLVLLWVVLLICALEMVMPWAFAIVYKRRVVNQRPTLIPVESIPQDLKQLDFKFGLCNCCEDGSTCLHAWCCSAVRIGETYSGRASGLYGFWATILVYQMPFIFGLFETLFFGPAILTMSLQIVIAIFFGTKRTALRKRLGGVAKNGCDAWKEVVTDIWLWFFCSCCVITQEARSVDSLQGVRVECCCNLQELGPAAADPPVVLGTAVPVDVFGHTGAGDINVLK